MAWGKRTKDSKATPLHSEVASRLLAELLDRPNQSTPLTVLDLGTGQSATVNYFAQCDYPSRLVFGDIADAQALFSTQRDGEESPNFLETVNLWRNYLNLSEDLSIDILLVWDLLHYFNLFEIEALSSVLQPHLNRTSQGYGFGALRQDQNLPNALYAVNDSGHIRVSPSRTPAPAFAHSQQALTENFVCMQISRGTLLQEGHVELLFHC